MYDEVVVVLAPTNDTPRITVHQHLRRQWHRIVSTRHAHSVRTGGKDGNAITALNWRKRTIQREEVAGFTNRADDVDALEPRHVRLPRPQDLEELPREAPRHAHRAREPRADEQARAHPGRVGARAPAARARRAADGASCAYRIATCSGSSPPRSRAPAQPSGKSSRSIRGAASG